VVAEDERGHRDDGSSAGPEDAGDLPEEPSVVLDVLEDLGEQHRPDRAAREREPIGGGLQEREARLPPRDLGAELLEVRPPRVERDGAASREGGARREARADPYVEAGLLEALEEAA